MIAQPFLDAVPVLEAIERSGFEAYFVGGSVRDMLLGRNISDIDIATSALPDELKRIFPKTTDVGIDHGTILVHFHGAAYEVTTFRAETGYSDFRRPDQVTFIRSLSDDLQRRDFTMNAMAMDREGRILDPFKGQEAIARREIATVGNPDERFSEDALRMLRAVRFLAQLSFEIEPRTLASLEKNCALLKNIAVERKAVEFEKILGGQNRQKAIEMLAQTGIHRYLPGLGQHKDVLLRLAAFDSVQLNADEMWGLMLACLDAAGADIESILRSWKLSMQKIKKLKTLAAWTNYRKDHTWQETSVFKAGVETAVSVEKIIGSLFPENHTDILRVKKLHAQLPIKHRSELRVTGNDLMEWLGKGPGPWIGQALDVIEQAVIERKVANDRDLLREWLKGAI